MLSLSQTTAPTIEPVSIEQAKEHIRVPFDDDNTYIGALVKAARHRVEEWSGRQLINASWTFNLNRFPGSDTILLPWSPLSSVTSVKYVDTGGNTQTVSSDVYDSDAATIIPKIFLKYNQSWPSDVRGGTNDVEIIFIAGYGAVASAVPDAAKQAILMMVSHWYEHREPVVLGTIASAIPETIEALISLIEVPQVA